MNKTKEIIHDFVSRSGHHDTTVEEQVRPAVVHETVKKTRKEEMNPAFDKEIHQDHYHHTVQPVHDRQVLPEDHQYNKVAVEHREYDHRNAEKTKKELAAETLKYKDERVVEPTIHSKTAAPTVHGEHIHHHIHEVVQPVIHKETIQPTVVHTTVPIHETHHNAAKHHATTALPAITMEEFQKKGGLVGSSAQTKEHFYQYEGEPAADGNILENATRSKGATGSAAAVGGSSSMLGLSKDSAAMQQTSRTTQRGRRDSAASSSSASSLDDNVGSRGYGLAGRNIVSGSSQGGSIATNTTASSAAGVGSVPRSSKSIGEAAEDGADKNSSQRYRDAAGYRTKTRKRHSLLDKLNPLTDSNGDGKAGFMK